jgi:hypothetical protein
VFERMLRRIFGPERKEAGEKCIMRSFIMCMLIRYYFTVIKSRRMGKACSIHRMIALICEKF